MRTFISIDMPEKIKQEIKKIQDKLPEFIGKKTELENLHLTLKFLGEIEEDKVEEVKKRLREIDFSKFDCVLDEVGFFAPNFIRIIWLHLTNCEKLQKEVDNVLEDMFEKEKRFMSHLTISRVKKVKDKKKFVSDLDKMKFSNIEFKVSNFKLNKSTLTPDGPIYEVIEEYKSGRKNII